MATKLYKYTTDLLDNFFNNRELKSGERFYVKFQKEEETLEQYSALKNLKIKEWSWQDYSSFSIEYNGIKLIIAAAFDDIKEDFLTGIRNGLEEGYESFKNAAVLFLFHKPLDSLISGCLNLSKGGMPLHIDHISRSILLDIKESDSLSEIDQHTVLYSLENRTDSFYEKQRSLFDLDVYLDIMGTGEIDATLSNKLGMFHDPDLYTIPVKERDRRLKKNINLFSNIENGHKYNNVENYLDKHFPDKGVEALSSENWNQTPLNNLLKWIDDKKQTIGVEYIPNMISNTNCGQEFWDREQGVSAVKKRIRNIIVFNENLNTDISLSLDFTTRLKKDNINYKAPFSNSSFETSGKKLTLFLSIEDPKSTSYFQFKYKDKNTISFKICIVPFNQLYIENIRSIFLVEPDNNKKFIKLPEFEELIINENDTHIKKQHSLEQNMCYTCNNNEEIVISSLGNENTDISDFLAFSLSIKDCNINFKMLFERSKPVKISGVDVWRLKKENGLNFKHRVKEDSKGESITIEQGTKIYYPQGDFRQSISREIKIIDAGGYSWIEDELSNIVKIDLELPTYVASSFDKLTAYLQINNMLPSTTSIEKDLELRALYVDFVKTVINELKSINDREALPEKTKNIIKLGTLQLKYGERLLAYTPLHPINIAYQLLANELIDDKNIPQEIVSRLGAANIVPFVKNNNDLYTPLGQNHSPEWLYYSNTNLGSQTVAKKFVPTLIHEKLNEFITHFQQLFIDTRRPIRVNLINMGDCIEALQGIFLFYQKQLSKSKMSQDNLPPVDIHIYSSEIKQNKFEELSQYSDTSLIEEEFKIDLSSNKDFQPEDWIELFHKKVHFYTEFVKPNQKYEYAHISFFQFDSKKISVSNGDMNQTPSSISMKGLMSDLSSISDDGNYRSSFGFKDEVESNDLITLAKYYNPLAQFANSDDLFDKEQVPATVINTSVRSEISNIYKSSQWVTYIDPKVDLSFFKEDKDVVIIHYSDQYNNSIGYDAITVTKKCELYQKTLKLELMIEEDDSTNKKINHIINIFNAINGEWLLKLNGYKSTSHYKEEKFSLLSALKVGLTILDHSNITWVPISLEEILRISGGVGLNKSDGLFSTKNLGHTGNACDDLLFIGFELDDEDNIKLHFLPMEVKWGKNDSGVENKAKGQILSTSKLLKEHLSPSENTFLSSAYRNFFTKLLLVNAGKFSLYDVWGTYSEKWDLIKKYQHKLLNDDFNIDWTLNEQFSDGLFVSFKNSPDYSSRRINTIEFEDIKIQHIELFKDDYLSILSMNKLDISKLLLLDQYADIILANKYSSTKPILHGYEDTETPTVSEQVVCETITTINSESVENTTYKSESEKEDLKVLFGTHANSGKNIEWFPTNTDKVMHTNTGIIGTMGTGKTQFTKSLITQLYLNSKNNVDSSPIGMLIFDYKGDYIKDDFLKATNAKKLDLDLLPYNPLALDIGDRPKPKLPLHVANNIKESISTAFNLGIKQKQKLRDVIMKAYEDRGILKSKPETWTNKAPTLHEVCEIYLGDPEVKEDSLYAAISNLYDFELFEIEPSKTKSLYDLLDGVTVINLSGFDQEIQNLVVAITLDLFYSQMQTYGHSKIDGKYRQLSKFVLVDEADNFLSKNFDSIKKIMKEGREFGVGTILSTQFLNHFSTGENEYSNYILTWIIHRVNEIKSREVESLFSINDKTEREDLMNRIKNLDKHYSIVNLAGSKPMMMRDRAFWELIK